MGWAMGWAMGATNLIRIALLAAEAEGTNVAEERGGELSGDEVCNPEMLSLMGVVGADFEVVGTTQLSRLWGGGDGVDGIR